MELSLMERFADPALFEQLSSSDKATGALITTVMGMGITFIILALLWGIIAIMAKAVGKAEIAVQTAGGGRGSSKSMAAVASAPAKATITNASVQGTGGTAEENPELIAVIMAAIAASEGSEFVNNLVIRKISRIAGNPPAWGRAGGLDCIESRKF